MEPGDGRKMYHLFIHKEGREGDVLMDALAFNEEEAKTQIPADFVFVRFANGYADARDPD